VIDALAFAGIVVILDDHTSDANWCCSNTDGDGSYTAPVWVGEFGTCHTSPKCVSDSTGQGLWFSAIGSTSPGRTSTGGTGAQRHRGARHRAHLRLGETYGVLDVAWSAPACRILPLPCRHFSRRRRVPAPCRLAC
jgi:hypothetical protein